MAVYIISRSSQNLLFFMTKIRIRYKEKIEMKSENLLQATPLAYQKLNPFKSWLL